MLALVNQAVLAGYTTSQILKFIAKKIPALQSGIEGARTAGFDENKILKFLSQKIPHSKEGAQRQVNANDQYLSSIGIKTKEEKEASKGKVLSGLIGAGAGALGTYALSRAIPSAVSSLAPHLLGGQTQTQSENSQIESPDQLPSQESHVSSQQPPVNAVSPNIAQPANIQQPKENISDFESKRREGLKKFNEKLEKGFIGKELSRVEKEYGKQEEEPSLVASPSGIGEVKAKRGGQALVEVDGKLHKVPIDQLEEEPEEIRESKFDFDPKSISEDLRSAPLNEVYIPYDKRHVTVKYNAGLKPVHYIYFRKDGQPISNDYINNIVQGSQLPISSGLNFWGAWDANKSDSRGAANYQELVKNAQEEGEKDDPSKQYWFIKEEAIYEHPYLKKTQELLKEKERAFNEERKKSKKKRS